MARKERIKYVVLLIIMIILILLCKYVFLNTEYHIHIPFGSTLVTESGQETIWSCVICGKEM